MEETSVALQSCSLIRINILHQDIYVFLACSLLRNFTKSRVNRNAAQK